MLSNDEEKEKKYLMSNKYKRKKRNGVKISMKPLIGSVILCRHDALWKRNSGVFFLTSIRMIDSGYWGVIRTSCL